MEPCDESVDLTFRKRFTTGCSVDTERRKHGICLTVQALRHDLRVRGGAHDNLSAPQGLKRLRRILGLGVDVMARLSGSVITH